MQVSFRHAWEFLHSMSVFRWFRGYRPTNLHSTFYHETFKPPNACFHKRHQLILQVVSELQRLVDIEFTSLPGMTPPQKPTSVQHWPWAASRLIVRFSTVVVGGIELSGMSTTVVTPPDSAALVPVQKPSHSVRPGSFKCTCALEGRKVRVTGLDHRKSREALTLRAQVG